jgi:hypothetical protein
MATAPFSIRLEASLLERLRRLGTRDRVPVSQLVERYLEEAVRTEELPGIVFRTGPAGRRAGLAGGPDVWEVVRDVLAGPTERSSAIAHVVATTDLTEDQVRLALAYYTAHPDEIDARLAEERTLAERLLGVTAP